MFLWCGCHCGPESASEPRSDYGESASGVIESYSSDDPAQPDPPNPPMPVTGCASCQYGVAPAAYDMSWSYLGLLGNQHRPCCSVYRDQQVYRLFFRGSIGACTWSCNENVAYAARQGLGGCSFPSQTNSRVVLAVPQRVPVAGGNLANRMRLTIRYAWDHNPAVSLTDILQTAKPSSVSYDLIVNDGTFWDPNKGQVSCLSTLTMKRALAQPIWNGTTTGDAFQQPNGAPCQQSLFSGFDMGLPEFLTITPVRI